MGGLRVLIVDDEEGIRSLIIDFVFPDKQHVTIEAADGEEAQNTIEKSDPPIDIVITDHDMRPGGMNGSSLVMWIRKHHPKILVVLMSGRDIKGHLAHRFIPKMQLYKKLPRLIKAMQRVINMMKQKPAK